jgi:hypothetical protein
MLPSGQTLPHILAHHLEASPDRTAVVLFTRGGEEHLSVGHCLGGAQAYCERYRRAGVEAGDVIVDLLPPGADLLFAFVGGILLGAVPCILPYPTEKLDPVRYRESLIALMQITHPAVLVAEPGLALEHGFEGNPWIRPDRDGGDGSGAGTLGRFQAVSGGSGAPSAFVRNDRAAKGSRPIACIAPQPDPCVLSGTPDG